MMGNLYPTQPWSKTMLVTRAFPEPVDPILQTLPLDEIKRHLLTKNGLSIAEEERMLDPRSREPWRVCGLSR